MFLHLLHNLVKIMIIGIYFIFELFTKSIKYNNLYLMFPKRYHKREIKVTSKTPNSFSGSATCFLCYPHSNFKVLNSFWDSLEISNIVL